ncbi:MAG: hypothetical protein DMG11_06020 [Acidobacteria bacterium]|nr:MAG: hypothetical protein DMG11_06020 [Acidobacteriota bacterium]
MSQSNVSSSEPELIESVPKKHLLVANECWFAMKKVLFATNKYSFATKKGVIHSQLLWAGLS